MHEDKIVIQPVDAQTQIRRKINWSRPQYSGEKRVKMASSVEQKALSLLRTFEGAGKSVSRVTIEGRRIEIELSKKDVRDEFERINMRHGET
ncbi:hypothetical protein K3729_07280 [Rhodobacteraceae bacterium S2214]|nr:hypothetical protein K3729_07280 [Rhodobacteraceae bacterium S2214]